MQITMKPQGRWPVLQYGSWKDTLATVHMWTQIVGKIRLRKMPWLNHSWHVTLYVTPWGLSTDSVPYQYGLFKIDFDFIHHELLIIASSGKKAVVPLKPMTVADFYTTVFDKLAELNIDVEIYPVPSEVEEAIPFNEDTTHKSYDAEQMRNFWEGIVKIHNVFTRFRAHFTGKVSPVHFFWGAFDLAVTRFSGRNAPLHTGQAPNMPARVMQEAYSKEVSSCGFWPGSDLYPHPAFYAYAYPASEEFSKQPVQPSAAFFSNDLQEFLLPYEAVRGSENPEQALLDFMQSTYEAAANTAHWDRKALECDLSEFETDYGCYK